MWLGHHITFPTFGILRCGLTGFMELQLPFAWLHLKQTQRYTFCEFVITILTSVKTKSFALIEMAWIILQIAKLSFNDNALLVVLLSPILSCAIVLAFLWRFCVEFQLITSIWPGGELSEELPKLSLTGAQKMRPKLMDCLHLLITKWYELGSFTSESYIKGM